MPHALLAIFALCCCALAQRPSTFRCAHVLAEDGASWRADTVVTVLGKTILDVSPAKAGETYDVDFGDAWLIPGLVDLHTHMCLHPYDEASWTEQVLEESLELRSMRAVAHARATLMAGFVAVRDLGTEGAGFADVALAKAVRERIVPGPVIFPSTRAIVATGCYGPNLPTFDAPKGAQPADGEVGVRVAVRQQIAAGATWIKVYADYRRAAGTPATVTFTQAELNAICDEARSAGVPVAAHATTDEGVRRAIAAGVKTIEHGSPGAASMLGEKPLAVLCPCLAASEAIVRYAGHRGPVTDRLNTARIAFQRALAKGVTIACGSDAGVFAHGDNARELELMVDYGMTPTQALAAATTTACKVLGGPQTGRIEKGPMFGFVVLGGDPLQDISSVRHVRAVVLDEGGDVRERLSR